MNDLVMETYRVVLLLGTCVFIWRAYPSVANLSRSGSRLVIAGVGLLLLGSLVSMVGRVLEMNGFVGRSWAETLVTISQVVGAAPGYLLLVVGLVRWLTDGALRGKRLQDEQQYHELVEAIGDWIWESDRDGRFVFTSSAVRDLLGYEGDAVLDKTFIDFMPEEGCNILRRGWADLLASQKPFEGWQCDYLHASGRPLTTETNAVPRFDDENRFLGYRGVTRDITQRRESEDTLREQADRLAKRMNELDCLHAISRLLDDHDRSVEQIVAKTARRLPAAYRYPEITCARVVLDGVVYESGNYEETIWKQSATIFVSGRLAGAIEVCYLENMPQEDEGPFLVEERNLINNIAETLGKLVTRKRAEDELAKVSREMEFILDVTNTGLDVINANLDIRYIDAARQRRLGDPAEKKCYEYLHQRSEPCDNCGVAAALERNAAVVTERRMRDEGDRIVQVTSIPFQDESGERLVAQVYADITERKRSENSERARQTAEMANEAKSAFLASMSHEIRTPMNAIMGFADVLLTEGDLSLAPLSRIEAIQTVIRNGNYLLQLIDDILDLSKIESGKLDVERIECSPAAIVEDVVELMQVRAKEKELALDVEFVGVFPETIQSDPTRLRQILINLLGNAIKFTANGTIRLRMQFLPGDQEDRGDGVLRFDVIDTGIGMTEEQIGRIFDPFTQADISMTRTFGGTGLGLTITRHLAKLLGGHVTVASQVGQGSTFRVTVATGALDGVKLVSGVESQEASARKLADLDAKNVISLDCRILLAEDGPDNQRLISFLLTKAGAQVAVVENGQLAVDHVQAAIDLEEPFDVILMDMQMPVLDGYGAVKKLRAAGCRAPIVALTASAMAGDREKCLDAGCDDYLSKPVQRQKLVATVQKYVGQTVPDAG